MLRSYKGSTEIFRDIEGERNGEWQLLFTTIHGLPGVTNVPIKRGFVPNTFASVPFLRV